MRFTYDTDHGDFKHLLLTWFNVDMRRIDFNEVFNTEYSLPIADIETSSQMIMERLMDDHRPIPHPLVNLPNNTLLDTINSFDLGRERSNDLLDLFRSYVVELLQNIYNVFCDVFELGDCEYLISNMEFKDYFVVVTVGVS